MPPIPPEWDISIREREIEEEEDGEREASKHRPSLRDGPAASASRGSHTPPAGQDGDRGEREEKGKQEKETDPSSSPSSSSDPKPPKNTPITKTPQLQSHSGRGSQAGASSSKDKPVELLPKSPLQALASFMNREEETGKDEGDESFLWSRPVSTLVTTVKPLVPGAVSSSRPPPPNPPRSSDETERGTSAQMPKADCTQNSEPPNRDTQNENRLTGIDRSAREKRRDRPPIGRGPQGSSFSRLFRGLSAGGVHGRQNRNTDGRTPPLSPGFVRILTISPTRRFSDPAELARPELDLFILSAVEKGTTEEVKFLVRDLNFTLTQEPPISDDHQKVLEWARSFLILLAATKCDRSDLVTWLLNTVGISLDAIQADWSSDCEVLSIRQPPRSMYNAAPLTLGAVAICIAAKWNRKGVLPVLVRRRGEKAWGDIVAVKDLLTPHQRSSIERLCVKDPVPVESRGSRETSFNFTKRARPPGENDASGPKAGGEGVKTPEGGQKGAQGRARGGPGLSCSSIGGEGEVGGQRRTGPEGEGLLWVRSNRPEWLSFPQGVRVTLIELACLYRSPSVYTHTDGPLLSELVSRLHNPESLKAGAETLGVSLSSLSFPNEPCWGEKTYAFVSGVFNGSLSRDEAVNLHFLREQGLQMDGPPSTWPVCERGNFVIRRELTLGEYICVRACLNEKWNIVKDFCVPLDYAPFRVLAESVVEGGGKGFIRGGGTTTLLKGLQMVWPDKFKFPVQDLYDLAQQKKSFEASKCLYDEGRLRLPGEFKWVSERFTTELVRYFGASLSSLRAMMVEEEKRGIIFEMAGSIGTPSDLQWLEKYSGLTRPARMPKSERHGNSESKP
uniref:Uncharacterized protein n=1 Tax=Chromera velia CCMP2878 TaxID=1169474 RepID=A0A0G4GG53_9ALVE|eukprot:Cvel_21689.t1-p1 / transcript=Cvel_21689.t1 / gene=Cvel_21689 / organism=Chromera_velia_CCMP2878 / gene_product=hypothetical protein / transcript_product=hypothetical protein / location=Cvel_scaffold2056:1378-5798(+) / protein_length=844 / sequence_SO=supercontig / SO=protein_coding / is_pseudo=false